MIFFDNRTNEKIGNEVEDLVHKAVEATLEYEEYSKNAEVSVSFVTCEEIKELNNKFRGKDSVTDVLSFPMLEFEEGYVEDEESEEDFDETCINPDTEEIVLGDIVLCVEKAKEQAQEYGHAISREIAFLTVHSMLHLLGYDHMNEEDEEIMRAKQREVLLKIGLER